MALKTTARYSFGLPFARLMPLNADLTLPAPNRLLGGIGPFDYSTAGDLVFKTKIDNADEVTVTMISTAADDSETTAAELVVDLNTALVAASVDLTASVDGDTGRIKIVADATPDYIQVYGPGAVVAEFGQGFGAKFVKCDTFQSASNSPTMKDEETFTTTDASGIDVEIISDGYRKGVEVGIVDTADDLELRALIEGGILAADGSTYEAPTSRTDKKYFFIEVFYAQYAEGINKEADLVGYVKEVYRTCKGMVGDKTHERGFADGNYTIIGTSYRDENGVLSGDSKIEKLTREEYDALDVYNV